MKYLDETGLSYFWNKIKAKIPSVINNLNSTSTTDALSAKQGKVLNEKFSTQTVTTTGTDLNDYTTEGTYYFSSTYAPTNVPAGSNGILSVLKGDCIKQLWYRHGTANSNDYQTFVRTYTSGTWSSWRRFKTVDEESYQSGETETVENYITGGYLTSSATSIRFSILLPKKMDNVTPTISSGTITVRASSGGYMLNAQNIKNATITLSKSKNYLIVNCTYSAAFSATNNTPVAVNIDDLKISFS